MHASLSVFFEWRVTLARLKVSFIYSPCRATSSNYATHATRSIFQREYISVYVGVSRGKFSSLEHKSRRIVAHEEICGRPTRAT